MSFTAFTIATMSVLTIGIVIMTIKIIRLSDDVRALRGRQNGDMLGYVRAHIALRDSKRTITDSLTRTKLR